VHPDVFSSLGGGEQFVGLRFNGRKVIDRELKGDNKSGPAYFDHLHSN